MSDDPTFDRYAADYDDLLNNALSISGETKDHFAQQRVKWTGRQADTLGVSCTAVLDFGCGIGSSLPILREELDADRVLGVDVSPESVARANESLDDDRLKVGLIEQRDPTADFDLAYCNGVFHHIPVDQRAESAQYVHRSLRPGGLFALWENNACNPGTRYLMSHCPFDEEAITLRAKETRELLRQAGFEIVRTDFLFVFPRCLSWLRPLEQLICRLPIGGQYMVLARKPA